MTAVFYIAFMILQILSMFFATSIEGAIVFAMSPIFAKIIGRIVLGERSTRLQMLFIVMTVTMAKYMSAVIPDELKASGQMLIGVVGFGVARTFGILAGGLLAAAMGGVQKGFMLTAAVAGLTMVLFAPRYLRMAPLNGRTTPDRT